MNKLILIICLLPMHLGAQCNDEIKVMIETIKFCLEKYNFDFVYEKPCKENYELFKQYPDSLFVEFNYATYEEVTKTGQEWYEYYDSTYYKNLHAYERRKAFFRGIILMSCAVDSLSENDHQYFSNIFKGKEIVEEKVSKIPIDLQILNNCGSFRTNLVDFINYNHQDKYMLRGKMNVSRVSFDKKKELALIKFGIAYRSGNNKHATTTSGILLFKKEKDQWLFKDGTKLSDGSGKFPE